MTVDEANIRGYLPGKREAVVFVALALLGLVASLFLSGRFSQAAQPFASGVPFDLVLYAALAFLAGFFFPKGFWLWGTAVFVLTPFAYGMLTWRLESRGVQVLGEGPGAVIAYAVILVMLALGCALLATTVSALGAGLRVLLRARGPRGGTTDAG